MIDPIDIAGRLSKAPSNLNVGELNVMMDDSNEMHNRKGRKKDLEEFIDQDDDRILYDPPSRNEIPSELKSDLIKENNELIKKIQKLKEDDLEKSEKIEDLTENLKHVSMSLGESESNLRQLKKSIEELIAVISTGEEKEKKAVISLCKILQYDESRTQLVFKSFKKKKGFF